MQNDFDRVGRITRVDLRVRPVVDVDSLPRSPAGAVAGRARRRASRSQRRRSQKLCRSYRVNMNVLALVALFTGGLLDFSTQALAVVRRRSQLALLRELA